MDERNQALPPAEPVLPAPEAPFLPPETPRAADPFADAPPPAPAGLTPDTARGLTVWLVLLVAFGVGGIALGLGESAALVAIAGLFIAAQAADLDPRWRLLYWMLTWVVPVGAALSFLGIGSLALSSPLPNAARVGLIAYCAFAALVSLALVWRPLVDPITVRLFHEDPPTHSLRLTTRIAAAGLLLAVPGSMLLRDQLAQMVEDAGRLFDPASLAGQLVGMVIVALAAVGFLVRRDLRGTLDRLGLAPLTARQWLMGFLGAGLLYLINAGAESLQHAWLPDQWAADRAMGELMSKDLSIAGALMLGVTAGVGEELTMRGALQPRLGLVLTSALFAALHVQYSWFGMGMILIFGLFLGTVRARTSTTVAIVVHGLYDVMAVLTT